MSRHRTSGPNAARDIIEQALEQSRTPRGAHRAPEHPFLSPRRITLTALVAGAVTMSGSGVAAAAAPADHAKPDATPQSADVTQQNSGKASSAQPGGLLQTGSHGDKVHDLQRVLNAWYPSETQLDEDGNYDKNTTDRVRYLQDRADLKADGVAGPETLDTLNMSSGAGGTPQQPSNTGDDDSGDSGQQDDSSDQSSDQQNGSTADDSDQQAASPDQSSDQQGTGSPADGADQQNASAPEGPAQGGGPADDNANQANAAPAGGQNDAPDSQSSEGDDDVVSPTSGQVTSPYGARGGGHEGVDIANDMGTPIKAATSGDVIDAGPADGYGQWVRVQHDDGKISVYGHINEAQVSEGDHVDTGQQIATMGSRGNSTGPHLHFEIQQDGGQTIDPQGWLEQHGASL